MEAPTVDMLAAALALHRAGCCVVPVLADGSKMPAIKWGRFTVRGGSEPRLTEEELTAHLAGTSYGIGTICGRASGDLEMLELEGRAVEEGLLPDLARLMADNDLGDVWVRIAKGYVEQSPSGGPHFHYRVPGGVLGNTALARRPATIDELEADPKAKVKVLVETRGEGGFTVNAPSAGRVHPSGRSWTVVQGTPEDIPELTRDEYERLHAVLAMLDQMPEEPAPEPRSATPRDRQAGEVLPGEDFAQRHTWHDLLTERGWTWVRRVGTEDHWRRPGDDKRDGISATTGRAGKDNIYNFSTSADLPTEVPLSKLGAYAHWHHGGNITEAVRDLDRKGYCTPAPVRTLELVYSAPPPSPDATARQMHPANQPAADPDTEPMSVTLSEDGNARLFEARHRDRVRHVQGIGWCVWDGKRWVRDADKQAMELMKETVHAIDPGSDKDIAKHKVRSLNLGALRGALTLASSMAGVTLPAAFLDGRGEELNTAAGAVDLRTGRLLATDPLAFHTRLAGYIPERVPTPLWDRFLDQTFQGDTELISYVQRLVGYTATGVQLDHVFPFCHGDGGNGKGVFFEVVTGALGDYATTAPAAFLMARYGAAGHENELARLHGARFVLCSEVNPKDRFDEQRIKMLTGGDYITARFLYREHFTFAPTHHLWLMGNHQPRVDAGGESFWRRLRLIPFLNKVPDSEKIGGLAQIILGAEGPGILQWVIDGAAAYFRHGLSEPAKVLAATHEYAEEEDAIARFFDDHCYFGEGLKYETARVRQAYVEWCHGEGITPLAPPQFGRELRSRHHVTTGKSNGKRFYEGMAMRPADAPSDTSDRRYGDD